MNRGERRGEEMKPTRAKKEKQTSLVNPWNTLARTWWHRQSISRMSSARLALADAAAVAASLFICCFFHRISSRLILFFFHFPSILFCRAQSFRKTKMYFVEHFKQTTQRSNTHAATAAVAAAAAAPKQWWQHQWFENGNIVVELLAGKFSLAVVVVTLWVLQQSEQLTSVPRCG